MKSLIGIAVGVLLIGSAVSCGAKEEKAKTEVDQKKPEYKAYDLVQNLKIVKDLQASAEAKNQSISLKLSKDLLNKGNGFYWFQVVQHVGNSTIVKMNITVHEKTFKVLIRDDESGENLSPEDYQEKNPVK
ncbi:hypothetical protein [Fluviicola taffensis]|uniref:hypothetical protein n=1 Tax=Fluviicola taffensis TaxID=191579 RepID=UPI003137CDB6